MYVWSLLRRLHYDNMMRLLLLLYRGLKREEDKCQGCKGEAESGGGFYKKYYLRYMMYSVSVVKRFALPVNALSY